MTATPFDQDFVPSSASAGGVRWLAGFGPLECDADCDHDCHHAITNQVAAGSTERTDKLVECSACACRCWFTRAGRPAGRWRVPRR